MSDYKNSSIRLFEQLINKLDKIAGLTKRSRNQVISMILENYFESGLDIFELDKRLSMEENTESKKAIAQEEE